MTLTLLAVSLNDQPLSQPITAHFDGRGGTIGRADHNTMALPDPERHVSRLQAEIVAARQGFLIRNVGAANPILVAGRAVARGESAPLAHLDEVRIGGYLLQVDCRTQEAALDITRGRAMVSTGGFGLTPADGAAQAAPMPAPAPPLPAPPAALWPAASAAPALAPTPLAAGVNPFADLLGPASASPPSAAKPAYGAAIDPFADLLGPAPAQGAPAAWVPPAPPAPPSDDPFAGLMPPPAGLHASSAALAAPAAPPARLPDDFDPFAAPAPASLAERAAQAPPPDPFADLGSGAAPASIDQLFGLGASGSADPLANFMAAPAAPPGPAGGAGLAGAEAVSTDPLLALFGNNVPPASAPPAQADHLSALNAAYLPPRVLAPPAAPEPAAAPPPSPPQFKAPSPLATPSAPMAPDFAVTAPDTGPAPLARAEAIDVDLDLSASAAPPPLVDADDAQRLWAALCAGAGIQLPLPPAEAEQRLREVGQLLRSAVDGTLRLMAVRASTKHELRAAVTVIQARGNNPLKFSPDAKAGLEYLLQPSVRGFLAGPAAMDDAMHDLVGHSIGTVAGMRAAIDGMLDRFAPDALESKLVGSSMLDSVLPSHRKARLWDLYLQHHQAIREEAHEDFQTLFGKAFLAAYDQQIDKLTREDKPR